MRLLVAQLNYTVGALSENADKIIAAILKGRELECELLVCSEMAVTGYPPEDLLLLHEFVSEAQRQLQRIADHCTDLYAVVGTVRTNTGQGKPLYNSAAVLGNGRILGYQDKLLLPTYDVFTEHRYFEPSQAQKVWDIAGKRIGITLCEDIWGHANLLPTTLYHHDPIAALAKHKPQIALNLSASPYSIEKSPMRFSVASHAARTLDCPFVLCNQVGGNDSLIFDGNSLCLNRHGELVAQGSGFQSDYLLFDTEQPLSPLVLRHDAVQELFQALVLGVQDYFAKQNFRTACIGLSGGIDSALVACIATEALGAERVLGVLMPSRYTSEKSHHDAVQLAKRLGIEWREVPIEAPFKAYLDLLQPHFGNLPPDATEENLQARIRGMILMALSNKLGYILLSTGNKSENAVGYATLYGDLCGGLAVINDVSKQQVYALARWINREREVIPSHVLTKEPSAELRPNQKDSDSLPPYAQLDLVVQEYVENHRSPQEIAELHGIDLAIVEDLVQRIHRNEYKRRQSPPGLRVTERAFTVGRRFPIVQHWVS